MCGGSKKQGNQLHVPEGKKLEWRQGDKRNYMGIVDDPNYKKPSVSEPTNQPTGGQQGVQPDGTVNAGDPTVTAPDAGDPFASTGDVTVDPIANGLSGGAEDAQANGRVTLGGDPERRRRKGVVGLAI